MTDTTIYNTLEKNGFSFIRPYVQFNPEWKVLAYVGGGDVFYDNTGCTFMEKNVTIGTAWSEEKLNELIQEIKRDRDINNLLDQ